MKEGAYHTPVLLKDCIEALRIRPDGTYVDATFGGGGHAGEILKRLHTGRLFAFDVDPDAAANAIRDDRFILIRKNFSELKDALLAFRVTEIDGLLADLGVSSHQFDSAERGFSTRFNAALDMRMDSSNETSASEIIRTYSEGELKRMLAEYGELRNAHRVAQQIAANRNVIRSTDGLKNAIAGCAEKGKENQFYAKVFQAFRIEVNGELNALKALLMQGAEMLRAGGRMAIISYHSLEDRLVKNFFRSGNFAGELVKDLYGNVQAPLSPINRKPIVPGDKEIEENSRARSAKLRIAEKH